MLSYIKKLFQKEYSALNKIEISAKRLLNNYLHLSSLNQNIKVAPVLKSNAYGHGIIQIAKILDQSNAPFFCVDSIYEAYELLKLGIKTKILVMGYIDPLNLSVKVLPFSYTVYNSEILQGIAKFQPQAGLHIFVDTGMHREGIPIDKLPEFLEEVKSLSLKVEGLMSHFAQAEKPEDSLTISQLINFEKAQQIVRQYDFNPQWIHICASTSLLNNKCFSSFNIGNMARVGRALYGISPIEDHGGLQPVLKFSTKVVQLKNLKKGEKVGYDFTYSAERAIVTAILPVGYNDGVDRRLSNKGFVTVNGVSCSIIGRVSMNLTSVDVTNAGSIKVGDEVVVYSDNPNDPNSIENAAKICGTIPYEIVIHFTSTTKREITII